MNKSCVSQIAVVGCLLLAGCAGPTRAPQGQNDSSASAVTISVGDSSALGSIDGLIVDAENAPLPKATAVILELGIGAVTSVNGSFLFDGVPPAQYTVSASKPGYLGEARRVSVNAGEMAPVKFQLERLAATEPYQEARNHIAMHHVGTYATDVVSAYYAGGPLLCEGCSWRVELARSPDLMLIEMWGNHTVPDATRANRELIFVDNVTTGNRLSSHAVPLPYGRVELNQSQIKGTGSFDVRILCDPGPIGLTGWPCVEEKRELWLTAFYFVTTIPANYSAKGGG